MKLLTSALGIFAAAQAYEWETYIPYDCFKESKFSFGNMDGTKISDYTTMLGLDAAQHQLIGITGCKDVRNNKITGLITRWGKWSAGVVSEEVRLNLIGRMSGLYHFDDSAALSASGVSLTEAQDILFQQYWFQEADKTQMACYQVKSFDGDMEEPEWTATRQEIFNRADLNGDGALNRDESREFLGHVRKLDRTNKHSAHTTWQNIDNQYERLDRHFLAAASLSSPVDAMSFANYVSTEKVMMAWYNSEKAWQVGYDSWQPEVCNDFKIGENDRIINMLANSNYDGVFDVQFQTVDIPMVSLFGTSVVGGFQDSNYVKFNGDKDFAGLWGTVDDSGYMNSFGWIERDSVCAQGFWDELGAGSYTWISPKPSNTVTTPEVPAEYKKEVELLLAQREQLRNGVLPVHDHDLNAERSLIAVTVLIWIGALVVCVCLIYSTCAKKK